MGKTERVVTENEVIDTIVTESPFPDAGKRKVSEVKETNFSGREAYVVTFDNGSNNVVTKDAFEAIAGYLKNEGN